MIALFDVEALDMQVVQALPTAVRTTTTGLDLSADLTFDEWQSIAENFGKALQSAAWCIGDWLVYGERKWGKQLLIEGEEFDPAKPNRVPSYAFDTAVNSTGLDRATLHIYASVCRKIPRDDRREDLSFGHHRILAPLPTPKRAEWMALLDSESRKQPTVKRLALSIRISTDTARIVTDSEIIKRGEHVGHDNYIPHLTRLLTCLRKTLPGMDSDQRQALKEDTAQLLEILKAL